MQWVGGDLPLWECAFATWRFNAFWPMLYWHFLHDAAIQDASLHVQRHLLTSKRSHVHVCCRGRGNLFLRHVERVSCIAYVLDLSGGQPEGSPLIALTPAQQLAVLQVCVWKRNEMK